MRYFIIIGLLALTGFAMPCCAQELSDIDKKEIRVEARKIIDVQLRDLLNMLAADYNTEAQREDLILNSYLVSQNKIFYDDKAVIQDDINPDNTHTLKGPDLSVRKYLDTYKLYYGRSGSHAVKISEVAVGEVQQKEYPFVKVKFRVHFLNSHRLKPKKYADVYREAELRAERPDKQWVVQISNIRFFIPSTQKMPELAVPTPAEIIPTAKPIVAEKPAAPAAPVVIASPETAKVEVAHTVSEVKKQEPVPTLAETPPAPKPVVDRPIVPIEEKPVAQVEKKPESPPTRTPEAPSETKLTEPPFTRKATAAQPDLAVLQKKQHQYKTRANLLRVASVAALAGSAVNLLLIGNAFNQYRTRISDQNAQLGTWWNTYDERGLTNGSNFGLEAGYRATPVTFMEFAKPGIYISAAGLAVSGVLWILSSKPNRQARQYRKQIEQRSKNKLSIVPQWSAGTHYAGVQLIYPF